jgi:hypothetical protein
MCTSQPFSKHVTNYLVSKLYLSITLWVTGSGGSMPKQKIVHQTSNCVINEMDILGHNKGKWAPKFSLNIFI